MVNYTKYGCEFVPCDISIPDMNEEQKEICREFVKRLCAPIQKEEFIKRIAKLRYLTANIPDDSESWKLRVAAYYDELSKYPASVVRYALTQTFKFFPTFAEIKEICDFECYRHNLLKRKFCND